MPSGHDIPMHVVGIRKETNTERVNWRITPSLIEEATCTIEVLEIGLILLTTEEVQITNLKVRPEVACGVPVATLGVPRTSLAIRDPFPHVVVTQV